jgi:hypothetical protein
LFCIKFLSVIAENAENNLKIYDQMNLTQGEKNKILGENVKGIMELD